MSGLSGPEPAKKKTACGVAEHVALPLSMQDNGRQEKRAKGFEPSTSSLGSYPLPNPSVDITALTPKPSAACTNACTSEGENTNAEPNDSGLATVADAWPTLPEVIRQAILKLLRNMEADDEHAVNKRS